MNKLLRVHGKAPYNTIVLHGGPGAAGEMYPVAKVLSKKIGVLEPMQTKYSINDQLIELKECINKHSDKPIVLIGWSWGAWLAYIFTAKYPRLISKLILISSGPFDQKFVDQIMKTRISHLTKKEASRLNEINILLKSKVSENKNNLFLEFGRLMDKADSYLKIKSRNLPEIFINQKIFEKVWKEASVLRKNGKLLKFSKHIKCPVVVIHGKYDAHPWKGVVNPLKRKIKNFKFYLLDRCGHHPWEEKYAKNMFYSILKQEVVI